MDAIASGASLTQNSILTEQVKARMQDIQNSSQAKTTGAANQASELREDPAMTGDKVAISEEVRALQQQNAAAKDAEEDKEKSFGAQTMNKNGNSVAGSGGNEDDENAADKTKESIMRQIREVKSKLSEAQAQLAQAKGGSGSTRGSAEAAQQNSEGGDPLAAAQEALAGEGAGGSNDAETIQAQVDMLNNQLLSLYQQLMQASQQGGEQAAIGTAGLGGDGGGRGGLGERIEVSA